MERNLIKLFNKDNLRRLRKLFPIPVVFVIIIIVVFIVLCICDKSKQFDYGAFLIGAGSLSFFIYQIQDQKKFSNRIADLQYCQMMEAKLIAILYSPKTDENYSNDSVYSVVTIEYLKFHLMRGCGFYVTTQTQGFLGRDKNVEDINRIAARIIIPFAKTDPEWRKTIKEHYLQQYNQMLENIKTEAIKEYYKNSNFQKILSTLNLH